MEVSVIWGILELFDEYFTDQINNQFKNYKSDF